MRASPPFCEYRAGLVERGGQGTAYPDLAEVAVGTDDKLAAAW